MGKFINLTGNTFGRLKVLRLGGRSKSNQILWLCRCNCGKEILVQTCHLNSGHTKSCGCYRVEVARHFGEKNSSHGGHGTRLYNIWHGMKQRCYDKGCHSFPLYGGRGISVCDEWKHDFTSFRDWAICHGYSEELSIDRIDTNGNYSPENCKWSTQEEQQNNKKNNLLLTLDGETHTAPEWGRMLGIPVHVIYNRIRYGWDVENILKRPKRSYRRKSNGSKQPCP